MKRTAKLALFLLFASRLHAADTPIGPFSFGKGLNVQTIPTEIDDDETPDSSNMINNRLGAAIKRKGSKPYISQRTSTNPICSLYRAYASTGSATRKALIMTSADKIYYSTTDINPVWIAIATGLTPNGHYSYATMNNKVIMSPIDSTDAVRTIDLVALSTATNLFKGDIATTAIVITGKYSLVAKNYYLLGNCADITIGTTFYASNIFYSILAQPSSMTASRFIQVRTDDGEQITGLGIMFDKVNIFKESSIHELAFTALNLPSQGGDQSLAQIVQGFGCIAPRTLQNNGQYYIFLSKMGILKWDGGRRSRLTLQDETSNISLKIKPIIDEIIRAGTYKNAVGQWYPKRQWYIFSYEDPKRFPHGKNNSVLVYDFITGEWFPFKNWLADSFTTQDGSGDFGDLLYGDSADGVVHLADVQTRADDSRKEISVNSMDNEVQWVGSTQDALNVKEGTASLKITANTAVPITSMTYNAIIPAGEWYDKTKITKSDLLSFKVYASSVQNINSLRVDLLVNDLSTFDTNFTSITLSSVSFYTSGTTWTTVELALSSFPIRADWTDLAIESVPFANTLTFYGVRFVLNGAGSCGVSIDDLRIAQGTDNPLNAYRFTKMWNFGTMDIKSFKQLLLTRDKTPDTDFFVDIFNNFSQITRTEEFKPDIAKELFVCGYNGSPNITRLNSIDFSLINSTSFGSTAVCNPLNGTADYKYLYIADRTHDSLVKIDRNDLTTFISTYGSLGAGTTNTNTVQQLSPGDNNLLLVDMNNQRIKSHSLRDFTFVNMTGSLGTGATSFHQPTGITQDDTFGYVGDEGNYRLVKVNKSTFGFVVKVDIDYNGIGDTSLASTPDSLLMAYNKVSENSLDNQDVILEKRDKANLLLLNRVVIRPDGMVAISTYALQGDITILGNYVYIPFTDNSNYNASSSYYIQKRLIDDLSLVKEYKSSNQHYSVFADGLSFKPRLKNEIKNLAVEGKYLQLKYYDAPNVLDNDWKLFNQTFIAESQGQKEE